MLWWNYWKRFKKTFVYGDSDSVHCVYLKQKKQTDS